MKTYIFPLILFISIILNIPVLAQNLDIKFKHFSLEEGLSQSTVYAILQDSQGFMWFGTQDGLNKYDGYQFTVYRHDPQDAHSLSHNEVFALYEDSQGSLWVGTGGGLNQFDPEQDRFIHYRHNPQNPDSLSDNTVWSICEDNTGILWIGTKEGGLNQFDRQKNRFMSFRHDPNNPNSLSHNSVWPLYHDRKGILWVGTDSGGLNRFDLRLKQFTHYWPNPQNPDSLDNVITSIYEDNTGIFWIGTLGGLFKFDQQQGSFVHYRHDLQKPDTLSHNHVWAIGEDNLGDLWIATDGGGLNQFDRQSNKFIHFGYDPHNPNSLNDNAILSIYQDRAGTMWVGTSGGGANQFNHELQKFEHYFHDPKNPNSLNNNHILSIYEDKQDILWVGTQGGGLNQFTQNRQKITYYLHEPQNPNSLTHNDISSLYEDSTGTLWVGTYGEGLNQFNREQRQFKAYRQNPDNVKSLSNNYILVIYEDSTRKLWVGTRKGLNEFDRKTETFIRYFHDPDNPNSLSHDTISSIYEDKSGTLWIGTQGGGVNKFNRQQNTFVRYQHETLVPTSLSHNEVSSINEDKNGILWISTFGGGINKFDRVTETFTHYREKEGLANDMVYGILEDKQGYLWISSNKGLSKFNPVTEEFRHYDVLDGLQSNEFNAVYHKSQRGEFFFGGINGFNAFYPERVKDNPYIPPIIITDFKIFNQSVPLGFDSPLQQHINTTFDLTLSYKQSFFAFEFAALNFLQTTKNEYAYQLEGFDNDWNYMGTKRNANYTNVPHGTYSFRVKGSNNDKVWNNEGTAIKITILPPPWKTWWAYTLYVLTVLAIIVGYVRVQRQKLREKQQELEREKQIATQLREADRLKDEFLANTSHELRTPLNGIIGIAESLIDGATGSLSQPTNTNLGMIVSSGRRLLNLVNDILDFSKLKKKEFDLQLKAVDMRTIAEVVLALSQPLIGYKKVQIINTISPELPPINADEDRVQQILYNLVGNAIKFTDSGTITVSTEKIMGKKAGNQISNAQLAVTVSDTGIGIAEEKLDRIFEAFEQADGSTARIYGGTGLGLAVTQQLVKLHGGQMFVRSQVGKGSQFTFTLPFADGEIDSQPTIQTLPSLRNEVDNQPTTQLAVVNEPLPENQIQSSSEPPQPVLDLQTDEFNILIVDDEPVNRQVLVNYLSLQNYAINQAASGVEALTFLDNTTKPDLILLDVMMPHKSGYEVTQSIRETWTADELPIILLTAKNQVADLVVGLESGANDYLTKPVSKDELLARIKTHLHILQLKAEALHLARENEKKLKQFLDAIPVGVSIINANGKPDYVNQCAQQILGKSIVEKATVEQLAHVYQIYRAGTDQEYPSEELPIVRALLQGESIDTEDMEIHRDGQIIPIESHGTPIFDDTGNIIHAINAFQDITERKQAEADRIRLAQEREAKNVALRMNQEIEAKNEELQKTLQQLKTAQQQLVESEKMAALGNLVAGVAHEINTPVGISVTASSQLDEITKGVWKIYQTNSLTRSKLEKYLETAQQCCDLILRNLRRAAELMKSFKQVAVDQSSEQQRLFMLKEYLGEVVKSLQPELRRTQHQISIVGQEIQLTSYPGAFSQIITNLIMNSLIHGFKEKPEGQMLIEVLGEKNEESEGKYQAFTLRYSDNGKGVPKEILNQIFDPFFTTNRQEGGSGLGLHIIYNLVTHKLNGTIHCDSIVGQGITFTIYIPLEN